MGSKLTPEKFEQELKKYKLPSTKEVLETYSGAGITKSVPKATRVVKELANKFTQSKKTLPEAMLGREKLKPAEPLGRPFKDKKEKELYGRFQQRMKKHGLFKDE